MHTSTPAVFTTVELLVVIAITKILGALLRPAVRGTRQVARDSRDPESRDEQTEGDAGPDVPRGAGSGFASHWFLTPATEDTNQRADHLIRGTGFDASFNLDAGQLNWALASGQQAVDLALSGSSPQLSHVDVLGKSPTNLNLLRQWSETQKASYPLLVYLIPTRENPHTSGDAFFVVVRMLTSGKDTDNRKARGNPGAMALKVCFVDQDAPTNGSQLKCQILSLAEVEQSTGFDFTGECPSEKSNSTIENSAKNSNQLANSLRSVLSCGKATAKCDLPGPRHL